MVNDESAVLDHLASAVVARHRAGVVVQDGGGAILDFNQGALDALAMTADQLRGLTSLDDRWEALDAAGQPLAGENHPAMVALATDTAQHDVTIGVRSGAGDLRWLSVDSDLHRTASGRRVVVSVFSDVTAEHLARARTSDALDRLQRHVLPSADLRVAGLRLDHRYVGVTPPIDVGGDFFDVFAIDGGAAFFMGDVSGHDLDAAATMVIARHTLRVAGLHLRRPERVLGWLHDTIEATPDTVPCTAIFGTISRTDRDDVDVQWANAGHPAPILVRRGGDPNALTEHGTLLGAPVARTEPPMVGCRLRPGDRLVLYTDGLLESQRPRLALTELLDRLTGTTDPMVQIDELIAAADANVADDTAVLSIGVPRTDRQHARE